MTGIVRQSRLVNTFSIANTFVNRLCFAAALWNSLFVLRTEKCAAFVKLDYDSEIIH